MRMLLTAQIPTEAGNEAIRDGTLPQTLEKALGALNPEAAYFTLKDGQRTAFVFFDMQESSQMPPVVESFLMELHAQVDLTPVMNADDLRQGQQKMTVAR